MWNLQIFTCGLDLYGVGNVYLLPKFVWGLSMFTFGLNLCAVCQCFHVAWIYLGFVNVYLWPGFDSGLDLSMLTCGLDLSVVWIC